MSRHTAGPWHSRDSINIHNQGLVISEATGANIAVTYNGDDARIIAAAPDMLAALRHVAYYFSNNNGNFMKDCFGEALGGIIQAEITEAIRKAEED